MLFNYSTAPHLPRYSPDESRVGSTVVVFWWSIISPFLEPTGSSFDDDAASETNTNSSEPGDIDMSWVGAERNDFGVKRKCGFPRSRKGGEAFNCPQ